MPSQLGHTASVHRSRFPGRPRSPEIVTRSPGTQGPRCRGQACPQRRSQSPGAASATGPAPLKGLSRLFHFVLNCQHHTGRLHPPPRSPEHCQDFVGATRAGSVCCLPLGAQGALTGGRGPNSGFKSKQGAPAGAQWLERWTGTEGSRVRLPVKGTDLGRGSTPGLGRGACGRQPIDVSLSFLLLPSFRSQ